jgi:hypothetical protein
LAKEWIHTGPPGILDISDIVAVLPQAPSETLAAVKDLFTEGLVEMNSLKTAAFLTPEGFETADHGRKNSGHHSICSAPSIEKRKAK